MRRPIRGPTLSSTDWLILGWWCVNAILFTHVVFFQPALWVTYVYNGLLYGIGVLVSYGDRTVRHVFILATVAGVIELGGDFFLVEMIGTLVYPEPAPMILASPLYMPLAWAIVTTQLGYVGIRLEEHYGLVAGMGGPALSAMSLIGIYEIGAHTAGIWMYSHAPFHMVGEAPLFIIVGEGLMFATIVLFARWKNPLLAGIGFGIVITLSYMVSYYLFLGLGAIL